MMLPRIINRGIIMVAALLTGPLALAATFNVNDVNDVIDANPGDGVCATAGGVCTLRAAIDEANALAGNDNINVPAGTYTTTNDLDITGTVSITGAGSATTIIDGGGNDRVFDVQVGSSATLSLMTIRNGDATTGGDGDQGGGIRNRNSILTLDRVIVRDNLGREGGGLWSREGAAQVTITDSEFTDNQTTDRDGGGIYLRDGISTLTRLTLDGNSARDGGGIFIHNGTRTFTDITFSNNNPTRDGGGIFIRDGNNTFSRITFDSNSGRDGGGIFVRNGTSTFTNVTVSGNNATREGGGIFVRGGTANFINATLSANNASGNGDNIRRRGGNANFRNTIVDNNGNANNCSGNITAFAGNLAFGAGCTGFANGDPLLGPLTNNGGLTETHALAAGSAAIDIGTDPACPAADQRGTARPQDGDSNGSFICDSGAYELIGGPVTGADLAVTMTDDLDPVTVTSLITYMMTVSNNGPDDATGVVLTDTLPGLTTYQSATPSQGSCVHAGGSPGGTLTCSLGAITAGSSATVEMIVMAPGFATTLTNNASATGNESDPNAGNNSASENTTVVTNSDRLCYLVADGGNILTEIDTADFNPATNETTIGSVGVSSIEAITYNSATGVLYAANAGQFGSLNLTTGAFSFIGNFGTGSGSLGNILFSDVDGLAYDATTGVMYGAHARGGTDVLIQIDMATGVHVPNAFGAGIDYVPISPILGNNITDDIAVDPTTGVMYASVNSGGASDRLITINKATGATTDIAAITVPDIEGLGTDFSGQLWGTSGTQNILYEIDKGNGVGSNGRPLDNGSDYEAVDCFAISPSVSVDIGVTKVVDNATPAEGDTINYTIGVANAGPSTATALQITDVLPAGVTFSSATPSQGIYDPLTGNWFIGTLNPGSSVTLTLSATVDAGTGGSTITNTAVVAFVSQGDTNGANDSASVDIVPLGGAILAILKSVTTVRDPLGAVAPAALAIPGATMEYTISVTNTGTSDANEVIVTDTLDANLSFLAAEYNGGAADIEIIVGAAPAVYCVAEVGGDTNADGCFLNAAGNGLTVGIPVSVTYPTGLTIGTIAPDNIAIVNFRVTVN